MADQSTILAFIKKVQCWTKLVMGRYGVIVINNSIVILKITYFKETVIVIDSEVIVLVIYNVEVTVIVIVLDHHNYVHL